MRAEAATALAEIAGGLVGRIVRHDHRPLLDRDVGEPHHLPCLETLVQDRLVDDHHHVAPGAVLVLGELGDRHLQHREGRVRAVPGRHLQPRDLGSAQVLGRRRRRSLQQLLAIDDLQHAALVGAVAEIDAIAGGSGRDRAVQFCRHGAGGAGLLAGQAEVADLLRMRGIGEVVDLRHAPHPPVGRARDEVGDAGVAFPPVLVRVLQPVEPRHQHGVRGIGGVPDLVRLATEGAEHVDGILVGASRSSGRQALAVAHAHHLRAAAFVLAGLSRDVTKVFGLRGIGNIDERRAVVLGLAGQRIDGSGHVVGAAVMADVGDPAIALAMDRGLVRRARLQVVAADQFHVGGFRRGADLLLLCCRPGRHRQSPEDRKCASHQGVSPICPRLYRGRERLS